MTPELKLIWFGKKYRSKGVEQVALTDYSYLYGWLKPEYMAGKLDIKLSKNFLGRLDEVEWRLNHFVPQVNCNACGGRASRLSIVSYDDPRLGNHVTGDYFYCEKRECQPDAESYTKRFSLVPLEYSSILQFPWSKASPKSFIRELHKAFARAAGWKPAEGSVTEQRARKFVHGLQLTEPVPGAEAESGRQIVMFDE